MQRTFNGLEDEVFYEKDERKQHETVHRHGPECQEQVPLAPCPLCKMQAPKPVGAWGWGKSPAEPGGELPVLSCWCYRL